MKNQQQHLQFALSKLFRVQLGVAGLIAVTVCVSSISPPLYSSHRAAVADFLTSASLWSLAAHLLVREMPNRVAVYAGVMVGGAMGGGTVTRYMWDIQPILMIAGAGVAASWLAGFAWLDQPTTRSK